MNKFMKILLYIFSVFIILNFIIFLVLLSKSNKKTVNDKIYNSLRVIQIGYIFIYVAFINLITGNLYKPPRIN